MGARRPSKTDRKKLRIKPDALFTLLALRFGKPSSAAVGFIFVKGYFTMSGVGAWIKETHEGREFANIVAQAGEAKRRAPYWYRRWMEWDKEQQHGKAPHP